MKVKVVVHGHLKGMTSAGSPGGPAGVEVIVPSERSRVIDLLGQIGLPLREVGFVARNGIMCAAESRLADGDEVAVFPILAGG